MLNTDGMRPKTAEPTLSLAKDYPWALFNCGELVLMLRVNEHVITAVAKYSGPGSPFLGKSKKSRPEKIFAFLQNPPEDFALPE